jgi:MoaA/NifB/PqqE/SkfB family radical SAM enzyme
MFHLRTVHLFKRHFASFLKHNTSAKLMNLCSIYSQFVKGETCIRGYPVEIIIDPTNMCTLRCPLCVTGQRKNERQSGMMPFSEFTRIIDELGRWLYKVRLYSWGESFLHKDLFAMISYVTRSNIGSEVSTNLQQFSPEDADRLIDTGLELLIVSLDGASRDTYQQYRIRGDFDKVVHNVRAITRARAKRKKSLPVVEIQFLVMRHNEHEIDAIRELAGELGADRVRIAPLTLNVRDAGQMGQWLPREEKWSRYDYGKKVDKIYRKRNRCGWLWRSAVINWDSTVSACCVFEGPKADLGSLRQSSFKAVWNNELYQQSRAVFSQKGKTLGKPRTLCAVCKGDPAARDDRQHGLY